MTPALTFRTASGALLAGAVAFVPLPSQAQLAIKRAPTGFNLFSVDQDIEVGRRAAAELRRQLPLVVNARTEVFLAGVTSLLAAQVRTPTYQFQVTPVNAAELNAWVLPDGSVYLSRGLLNLARQEAEVAGVLAHAMAHVVLRHGTARVSKAYLANAGLTALGGLVGGRRPLDGIVNAVGGYGLEGAFLDFGLSDEYEADALGAELMSRAGYDPVAMASMFATMRRERGLKPGLAEFFRSHPSPPDRESRIRNLSNVLSQDGSMEVVGGLSSVRWSGRGSVARPVSVQKTSTGTVAVASKPVALDVPKPSRTYTRFTHPGSQLSIDHPSNWDAIRSGVAISFAPAGGVIEHGDGRPHLVYGVIVNYYAPFENDVERWNNSLTRHYAPFEDRTRPRGVLEDATDDLVRQILSSNSYLSTPTGSARASGSDGYRVRLSGRSPVTGQTERVTLLTRALQNDQVVYLACVSPARGASAMERACGIMARSLRVNDAVANRP